MSTQRDPAGLGPAIAAGIGSAILSVLALLPRPLVNNDGILYLVAADAYARGGFGAARQVHGWPFHSVLIAGVAGALRVSTEVAAQITGAALLAAACMAFVGVARALGGDRRFQWLAAAVVLAHPWLNASRALVVRDVGVWAFGLLALALALQLDRPGRLRPGLRFVACSAAAVLFRPDAIVLMAAAPVALLLHDGGAPRRERVAGALALLVPVGLAAAGALAWILAEPVYEMSAAPFRDAAAALASSFPLPYGREYAPVILGLGLLAVPIVKTLKAAGLAHVALTAVGIARTGPARPFHRVLLWTTLAAAVLPLFVHVFRLLFVESRYTVFATLVLAAWAVFGLSWLVARGRGWAIAAGLALALTLAFSLPVRPPRESHVRDAAEWIRRNAAGARLHTNSLQLAYASGAPVDWPLVHNAAMHGAWDGAALANGELWAVRVAPSDDAQRGRLSGTRLLERVASFVGADGDAVFVYRCRAAACVSGS
jgi:hypothetical protein